MSSLYNYINFVTVQSCYSVCVAGLYNTVYCNCITYGLCKLLCISIMPSASPEWSLVDWSARAPLQIILEVSNPRSYYPELELSWFIVVAIAMTSGLVIFAI